MSAPRTIFMPSGPRRGSVFILVVSILAVLALLVLVMSYSTKMELMAARNWANGVQARMAAVTGVPLFSVQPGAANSGSGIVTPLNDQTGLVQPLAVGQLKSVVMSPRLADVAQTSVAAPQSNVTGRVPVAGTAQSVGPTAGQAGSSASLNAAAALAETPLFEDESAKININAILPWPTSAQEMQANVTQSAPPGGAPSDSALPVSPAVAMMHEDMLARYIAQTLLAHGVNGVDPRQLAHAIAMRRLGSDGLPSAVPTPTPNPQSVASAAQRLAIQRPAAGAAPNQARQRVSALSPRERTLALDDAQRPLPDPWDYWADPRRVPRGDDQPFASVDELLGVPGMTLPAYVALAPGLTVFSVGFAAYQLPNTNSTDKSTMGWPQIDPNTAAPELIFEALRKRFPAAPDELLGQFTANLIDRRDPDDKPSDLQLGANVYHGFEKNPYINELCSDSSSFGDAGGGDDGQFIELYNPFSTNISLTGWRLTCGGVSLVLTGELAADGYLVVVRDFNNENDADAHDEPDQGSFFNIYHIVPTDARHRLIENRQLNLPLASGTVNLMNDKGDIVDVFDYQNGAWTGAPLTFQRTDPRLRASVRKPATPLAPNPGQDDPELLQAYQMMERFQNQPFRTALDVMSVSTSYAPATASDPNDTQPHALPQLSAGNDQTLDLRMVDCFHVGIAVPDSLTKQATAPGILAVQSSATGALTPAAMAALSLARSTSAQPECGKVFGRLNLNTAPLATLAALPGMSQALLTRIYVSRHPDLAAASSTTAGESKVSVSLDPRANSWWETGDPLAAPRWRNLSDFLGDEMVWQGRPLYDRLDAVYPFAELVCMQSMAMRMITSTRTPQDSTASGEGLQQPSRVLSERILAGDRGAMETVLFRLVSANPNSGRMIGDPDLRYSMPESQAGTYLGILSLLVRPQTPTTPASNLQAVNAKLAPPPGR